VGSLVEAVESRKKRRDLFTYYPTEARARQPRHSSPPRSASDGCLARNSLVPRFASTASALSAPAAPAGSPRKSAPPQRTPPGDAFKGVHLGGYICMAHICGVHSCPRLQREISLPDSPAQARKNASPPKGSLCTRLPPRMAQPRTAGAGRHHAPSPTLACLQSTYARGKTAPHRGGVRAPLPRGPGAARPRRERSEQVTCASDAGHAASFAVCSSALWPPTSQISGWLRVTPVSSSVV
jgi:hypothetical protein